MKQRTNKLFEPAQLKALSLQNRIVMAPMTRARTTQPGNIPNEMMATYYQQRASAGLAGCDPSGQITRRSDVLSAMACGQSVSPNIPKW